MEPGRYHRPEGLVTWHGALWRAYDPAPVAAPKPKVYARYISDAEKCDRVIRALTTDQTQADLQAATGLTKDQMLHTLAKLLNSGAVSRSRARRGAWRYRRAR